MRKEKYYLPFILLTLIIALSACGGKSGNNVDEGVEISGDTLEYSKNLFIKEGEGCTIVTIRNPWDTTRIMSRYVLVDRDKELPAVLPKGTVVKVPVKNALVGSALHCGLIKDFGAGDNIGGVFNASYVTDSLFKERIAKGGISDCGSDMNPDIEKIIKLNPEIIMVSPFENNDRYAKASQLGIPMIECADYMENSALGQAEWMKFYGLLFGKKEESEQKFIDIRNNYNHLRKLASESVERPSVILDQKYGQSWSVPGGRSTMSKMIVDAGAVNPFSGYAQSGGVELSPEKVLAQGGEADIWLLRYNQGNDKTMKELASDSPEYSRFKAFREGRVYGCNTKYSPFFDETPFHPDLLLEEMVKIFHPGIIKGDTTLRYFKQL